MKISELFRKIQRNWEDFGLYYTLKRSLLVLLSPFYEKATYRIYKVDLAHVSPKKSSCNIFSYRLIQPDETQVIEQIEKLEEWLSSKLKTTLENGSLCLVAFDKETVAGFNLIRFGEVYMPLIKLNKVFADDEAWSEQITVRKDYRKKGLAIQLRYRIFFELKNRGIKKLYGGSLIHRLPNLRLSKKVGFRDLVDIDYRKLFYKKKWDYRKMSDEQF